MVASESSNTLLIQIYCLPLIDHCRMVLQEALLPKIGGFSQETVLPTGIFYWQNVSKVLVRSLDFSLQFEF